MFALRYQESLEMENPVDFDLTVKLLVYHCVQFIKWFLWNRSLEGFLTIKLLVYTLFSSSSDAFGTTNQSLEGLLTVKLLVYHCVQFIKWCRWDQSLDGLLIEEPEPEVLVPNSRSLWVSS